MDRLLASKPHERYQTAEEAAESLAGLSHRKSPREKDSPRKTAVAPPPVERAPAPPPPEPEPEYIEVRPEYAAWFRPLAELAERSSAGAFIVLLVVGVCIFILGLFAGILVRASS
jgi:hypothetical protein